MPTKQEILRDLRSARDEVRVRAHLLSMDARTRWGEIETKLEELEQKLNGGAEKLADALVETARTLTRSARDLASQQTGVGLTASQIMTTEVRSCSASDTLNRAAELFWNANCGAVPVVDPEGKLIGMLTDRDVCIAAYTQGKALHEISVEIAMSHAVYSAAAQDTLGRVLEIMGEAQVHRVPVVDEQRRLLGIISLADIARQLEKNQKRPDSLETALLGAVRGISERPTPTETAAAAE